MRSLIVKACIHCIGDNLISYERSACLILSGINGMFKLYLCQLTAGVREACRGSC